MGKTRVEDGSNKLGVITQFVQDPIFTSIVNELNEQAYIMQNVCCTVVHLVFDYLPIFLVEKLPLAKLPMFY